MASQASQASPNTMQKLLTVQEAAEFLNLSKSTVYRYVEHNDLPHIRKSFGLRFRLQELEKWIDQDKQEVLYSDKNLTKTLTSFSTGYIDTVKGGKDELAKQKPTCINYGKLGSIFPRTQKNGVIRWYIYYRKNKKRIRELIPHAKTEAEAYDVLVEKRHHESIKIDPNISHRITFQEFAEVFMTGYSIDRKRSWKSDRKYLDSQLIPFFGSSHLHEITPVHIQAFIQPDGAFEINRIITNIDLHVIISQHALLQNELCRMYRELLPTRACADHRKNLPE